MDPQLTKLKRNFTYSHNIGLSGHIDWESNGFVFCTARHFGGLLLKYEILIHYT